MRNVTGKAHSARTSSCTASIHMQLPIHRCSRTLLLRAEGISAEELWLHECVGVRDAHLGRTTDYGRCSIRVLPEYPLPSAL